MSKDPKILTSHFGQIFEKDNFLKILIFAGTARFILMKVKRNPVQFSEFLSSYYTNFKKCK